MLTLFGTSVHDHSSSPNVGHTLPARDPDTHRRESDSHGQMDVERRERRVEACYCLIEVDPWLLFVC